MKDQPESETVSPSSLFAPTAMPAESGGTEHPDAPTMLARGSGHLRSSALNTLLKGRYDLRRRIGSGGMAEVYLGWDLLLEREVAVKLLREEFTRDAQQVARFRREAQMLARVDSDHVIQIYDMHFGRDECYLVLRHVIGRTLDRMVASNGPVAAPEALQMVADVLEGLAHLHAEGLVHRDVKPSNVLVGNDERAVLLDLGVACDLRKPHITPTNFTAGTPSYMAPEQKETGHVDERTDIYQAGLLLLFAVTAVEPARLTNESVLEDILLAVPDGVATIVEKATATDADRRYRTSIEMRGAVLAALDAAHEPPAERRLVSITIPPKSEPTPAPATADTIEAAARAAADWHALSEIAALEDEPTPTREPILMLDKPKEPETQRERPEVIDPDPEIFDIVDLEPAAPVIAAKEVPTDPFATFDTPLVTDASAHPSRSGVRLLWSRGPSGPMPSLAQPPSPHVSEQGMLPLPRPKSAPLLPPLPTMVVKPLPLPHEEPRHANKLRIALLAAAVGVCVLGVSRKLEHFSTDVQEPPELSFAADPPPVTMSSTPSALPAAAAASVSVPTVSPIEPEPLPAVAPTRAARVPVASPTFGQSSSRFGQSPSKFVRQGAEYEHSGNIDSALRAYRSYLRLAPEGDQAGYVRIRVAELEARQSQISDR
ncbi:MAG TPA: protein kinase [Kofleriaceae bacterium]|jgi:serine/threonine protein kinase